MWARHSKAFSRTPMSVHSVLSQTVRIIMSRSLSLLKMSEVKERELFSATTPANRTYMDKVMRRKWLRR